MERQTETTINLEKKANETQLQKREGLSLGNGKRNQGANGFISPDAQIPPNVHKRSQLELRE